MKKLETAQEKRIRLVGGKDEMDGLSETLWDHIWEIDAVHVVSDRISQALYGKSMSDLEQNEHDTVASYVRSVIVHAVRGS